MLKKIFLTLTILSLFFLDLNCFVLNAATGTIAQTGNNSCPSVLITQKVGNNLSVQRVNLTDLLSQNGVSDISALATSFQTNPNNPDTDAKSQLKDANGDSLFINTTTGEISSDSTGKSPLTRYQLLKSFGDNIYSQISCPAKFSDLQTLFLRLLVVINTIVGFVVLFVLGRAALTRMTSRGSAEAVKKSYAMFTGAIIGLLIVLMAYTGLIFVGTRLLPQNDCFAYSFIDSGKILFFFDQSDISPVLNTPQDKSDLKSELNSLFAKQPNGATCKQYFLNYKCVWKNDADDPFKTENANTPCT